MRRYLIFVACAFAGVLSSCTGSKIAAPAGQTPSGRYAGEFPAADASGAIEKITHSVKKIYSVSSYTTYQFRREARITGYIIQHGSFKNAAWGVVTTNETVFGTATVISFANPHVALLTCAHVVSAPDTLVSFYESGDADPAGYVRSLSIREKQENWVKDLSSCGPFTVLAMDASADIAILGKNCESLSDTVIPFPCFPGKALDLQWGSLVHIFGYPMGNQVITRGIASPLPRRPMGDFSIDALLNKGYSGGIILATRNGEAGFDLVGVVKSVSSSHEEFLKPAQDQQRTPDWIPYQGETFVGSSDHIQYGLNAVITIESILEFYKKNRPELVRNGYNLDHFFLASPPGKMNVTRDR